MVIEAAIIAITKEAITDITATTEGIIVPAITAVPGNAVTTADIIATAIIPKTVTTTAGFIALLMVVVSINAKTAAGIIAPVDKKMS
jgi:hypothetical protein